MLGLGATGQFAIGEVDAGTAETILADKWYQELSMPVRTRPGLRPGQQQFGSLPDPFPFVSFGWFQELPIPPVRTRQGLRPGQQQFAAADTAVIPVSRMVPWFVPLSEPVRFRPGLRPGQQQFGAADPSVIPIGRMIPWFVPLGEPVRTRPGLAASRQQFLAAPSQLRPTPQVTGVLDALETKDTLQGSATTFNPAASAEIGVANPVFFAAEIGVSVQGASGTIASVAISISIV